MKRLEYEEALGLLLEYTAPNKQDRMVPLLDAMGLPAAQDIVARREQPPFDRSPLDGYALISVDTVDASPERPVTLALQGTILAGDCGAYSLAPGQAFRIMTGAKIPPGADCIIRQESVSADARYVHITQACRSGENYCLLGEDISRGQLLIACGERINTAHIGVLAAQGVACVPVCERPVIGLFSTGNEVAELGLTPGEAQIYDSNSYMLAAELAAMGALVRRLPPQPDATAPLASMVRKLWEDCDAVITTGGVSVGLLDCMPGVAASLCGKLLFHGVNLKPGTPLLALEKDGKLLLALSGNPFAAMATFTLFAQPMVRKLAGLRDFMPQRQRARLLHAYHNKGRIRRFVRATLQDGHVSVPKGNHSPGALLSMIGCNCLIDVPPHISTLYAGDEVEIVQYAVT